jgi:CysZ protein
MIKLKPGNNPLFALSCLLQGLKLTTHPQLRKYLLIPLFINLVLYSGAFVLGYFSVSGLIEHFIPAWLAWLHWILWPLFFISFLIIGFFSFTLLANLIAAPYYSELATKALELISGQSLNRAELPWNKVFFGELQRLRYILLRTLPLVLLSFIPVVNMIAPLLWAVFAGWSMAMEYLAYPLEHRGLAFTEQKQFLQQSRWGALSFGGLASLGLTVPILNLVIGQAAVIGATIYVYSLAESAAGE